MSYLIQIADPEGLHVAIQSPGLYNPDILEDVTARCVDTYRDALSARAEIGAVSFERDDDEEVDVAELLRVLESLDDDDTDEEEALGTEGPDD